VPLGVSTNVEFSQLTDNFYRVHPVFATVLYLVILLAVSTVCHLLLQLSSKLVSALMFSTGCQQL
jgi:hypothetical protein